MSRSDRLYFLGFLWTAVLQATVILDGCHISELQRRITALESCRATVTPDPQTKGEPKHKGE